MNVMLLAAGEGTRLRPHTLIRPKPAMPFLNVPLACYPLAFLEDLKIDHLVVNTFHLPTKVVDLFMQMNHGGRKLYFSHEVNQIMGSGGGLSLARDYFKVDEDLVMMNADEVILPLEKGIFAKALEQHKKNRSFCTLLTMKHEDVGTKFGGVWLDQNRQVKGFGKTKLSEECTHAEHFIGVQILSGKIFEYLAQGVASNILYDAVTAAIQDGHRVETFHVNCHWFETGNPADFLSASKESLGILSSHETSYAQTHLRRLLERYHPEKMHLTKTPELTLLKVASAVVDSSATLSGFAVLGARSNIQANAKLSNVVVADKITIAAGTQAANQIFLENN